MNLTHTPENILRRARRRLASERGFTMLIALGVLAVTSLLLAAVFVAVQGDVQLSQHDLASKRAYLAARAGLNAYLYQLNQNPLYWETCANNSLGNPSTPGASVPGSTTGTMYSYVPIYNSGHSTCGSDPIAALIDPSTGTLRLEFVGFSGNPATQKNVVQRGIVASFRKDSPLDFLWYTVYEALDSTINGFSGCNVYYRNSPPRNSSCNINWVSGDSMKGPMYTKDQYLVSGFSPTFGRDKNDKIESMAPGSASAICAGNNCGTANIKGEAVPNAPDISTPSANTALQTDATAHGVVVNGTSTITLSGSGATIWTCPGTIANTDSMCTSKTIDLTQTPIIYVNNSCPPSGYTPFNASYPTTSTGGHYYGCEGDVYVSGSYTTPVTIAAANDIIVADNITTSEDGSGSPSGVATLGLVANRFVRVMHGVSARQSAAFGQCKAAQGATHDNSGNVVNQTSNPDQTLSNLKIDGAILALQHSFIVDNYDCGVSLGTLTANGAIAQYYRGTVGTTGGSGYLKNYTYDSRLAVLLPPYLFDIATSGWHTVRETLCIPTPAACT